MALACVFPSLSLKILCFIPTRSECDEGDSSRKRYHQTNFDQTSFPLSFRITNHLYTPFSLSPIMSDHTPFSPASSFFAIFFSDASWTVFAAEPSFPARNRALKSALLFGVVVLPFGSLAAPVPTAFAA